MIKQIFSSLVLFAFAFLPIFGVEVQLPNDHAGDDINITIEWQTSNTRVRGDEETVFKGINLINEYLWWSFTIVCAAMVIYGGFELITANGDKKAMKKAQWAFIASGIGIAIALLSYAFVKIIANLM